MLGTSEVSAELKTKYCGGEGDNYEKLICNI